MAYRLRYSVNIDWIGDGIGQLEVSGAQTIGFSATVPVPNVPGTNSVTQANFNQALSGATATPTAPSLSADIAAQIAAQLTRIQGFVTGGG